MAEYETREVSRFETKEKLVRNNKTLLQNASLQGRDEKDKEFLTT